MQDDLTWCVSKAKAIPRWKNGYLITKDVRLIVSGTIMFILVHFIVFMFTAFEEKAHDFWFSLLVTVQCLINFSSTFNPKKSTSRFYFTWALVAAFWLIQIFCGFLISFNQRILYEDQINTHDELTEKNFRLAGDPHVFDYLTAKNVVSEVI